MTATAPLEAESKRREGPADPPQPDDEGQRLARYGGGLQSANLVRSADIKGGFEGGASPPLATAATFNVA